MESATGRLTATGELACWAGRGVERARSGALPHHPRPRPAHRWGRLENSRGGWGPENWIEPELRDDKTPLFEQLESTLRQSDVTDEAAEAAYRDYLSGLHEIADLKVVGMVHHDQKATPSSGGSPRKRDAEWYARRVTRRRATRRRASIGVALLLGAGACGVTFEHTPLHGAGGEGGADAPEASSAETSSGKTSGTPSSGAVGGAGGVASSSSAGADEGGEGGGGGAVDLTCPSPDTVCCGEGPCPLPTMECCSDGQSQTQSSVCVPAGTCGASELAIRCDDSEDCSGDDVCCATWDGNNHLVIECKASCTPPSTLGNAGTYPMCSYPSGTCPTGLSCYDDCCVGDLGIGYCF